MAKLAYGQPLGDRPLLLFGVMMILLGAQSFLAGLLGEMVVRPEMEGTARLEIRDARTPEPLADGARQRPSLAPEASPARREPA